MITFIDGKFNVGDSYGIIEITNFCNIYIVWEAEKGIKALYDVQRDVVQDQPNRLIPSHPPGGGSILQSSTDQNKHSSDEECTSANSDVTTPLYVYEGILIVPSDRFSIVDKDWVGVYSIYPKLEGWKSVL